MNKVMHKPTPFKRAVAALSFAVVVAGSLVAPKVMASVYTNVGSDDDYVVCMSSERICPEPTDGNNYVFGNYPTQGRLLEINEVRPNVIQFRFYSMGRWFNPFYAEKVNGEWVQAGSTEKEKSVLIFKGDYVAVKSFNPAKPDDKNTYTYETFFLSQK